MSLNSVRPGGPPAQITQARHLQLIRTIFHPEADAQRSHRIIALASVHLGGGASSATADLGAELACYSGNSTLLVETAALCSAPPLNADGIVEHCLESQVRGFWRYQPPEASPLMSPPWDQLSYQQMTPCFPEYLQSCVKTMSQAFVYVLLDCQPLGAASDALMVAPLVDGVVLVIEAGRTTKAQINRALRMIEMSRGKVLGFILNKRRYPIPASIYKRIGG
ncbi:MAG TPA: hypothetical protein VJ302_21340 [Blastocatellia bacterium]|nr:hypothetical protein [Blastocatellia bacterium]